MRPSELMMLPWSIIGPRLVEDEHGNRHYEMRVKELPDFFVAGSTDSEALYDFKPALLAFLDSYAGETLPALPAGTPARYALFSARPRLPRLVHVPSDQPTAGTAQTPASLQPQ